MHRGHGYPPYLPIQASVFLLVQYDTFWVVVGLVWELCFREILKDECEH